MYCPKCGTQVQENQRFCANCGTELPLIDVAWEQLQTEEPAVIEYAGFWLRLVAYIIDTFIMNIAFVLFIVIFFVTGTFPIPDFNSFIIIAPFLLLSYGIPWLYYSIMESSRLQATVGKMAMNIKVTDIYGNRISFARATGRHFARYISMFIFYIGFIMVAFTQKKQGLHDMMTDTLVVVK